MLIIGLDIIDLSSLTFNIFPDTDGGRNLGSDTKRFAEVRGQDGIFIYGGSITVRSNTYASMVCAYAKTSGTVGNYESGYGRGKGVITGGYLDNGNSILASGDGSVAFGKTKYFTYFGNIKARGDGSTALGFANGGQICSEGEGSFVQGYCEYGGILYSKINGRGGFSQGFVKSPLSQLYTSQTGAFAQGYCYYRGDIEATNDGSFAQGSASNFANIIAGGDGSFAQGYTYNFSETKALETNSVQFGPGTNNQYDTLQVGSEIRLKGTINPPFSPNNGDIWVKNNYVYIQSGYSPVKIVYGGIA